MGAARWAAVGGASAAALAGLSLAFLSDTRAWGLILAVMVLLGALLIGQRRAVNVRNTASGSISGQMVQLRDNSGSITLRTQPEPFVRIPGDTAVFTGRREEVALVSNVVISAGQQPCPAVLVVHGPVGVGKTALVVRVAHQLSAWCDYCLFVDLGAEPPPGRMRGRSEDALARLLADPAVGVRQPGSAHGIRALWRDQLSGRRVLLVLDNVRSAEQVLDLLPDQHVCRVLAVLVTSRTPHERLRRILNADHLKLGGLPADDALRLLHRCAGRTLSDSEQIAASELIRRCAFLPLSICVYGARLHTDGPALTITQLLTHMGDAAADGHDSTAVFIQAYHQLPATARHMLRHLGVHPGPDFDVSAAAALAGRATGETQKSLAVLVDRALITQDGNRYRMHEQFRHDVARFPLLDPNDAAREPDHAASLHRLLYRYQQAATAIITPIEPLLTRHSRPGTVPAHAPDPSQKTAALAWFKSERANVIACLRHVAGNAGLADAMVALTDAVAGFLRHEGPWETAVELHTAAAEAATTPRDRAVALNDLGIANRLLARYEIALSKLEYAYEATSGLANERDILLGQANAKNEQGKVANLQGRYPQSLTALQEALDSYQRIEDTIGIANAAKNLGDTCYQLGDHDRAREYFHQAMTCYFALNDELGLAEVHNHLGSLYLRGDALPEKALREFRTAQGFAAAHSPLEQGRAAEGIASCLITFDIEEAIRYLTEAIYNYKRIGATSDLDRVLPLLHTLNTCRGRP